LQYLTCYPFAMPRTTRRDINKSGPEMVEVIDAMRLCHAALVTVARQLS